MNLTFHFTLSTQKIKLRKGLSPSVYKVSGQDSALRQKLRSTINENQWGAGALPSLISCFYLLDSCWCVETERAMEKAEKVKEKGDALLMGDNLKLKRSCRQVVVGKREGNSTPSPTWKFGFIQSDGTLIQDTTTTAPPLSARKLGANLWEMQRQINHMDMAMVHGSNAVNVMGFHREEKISPIQTLDDVENPSDQTTSCANLREQVAALPARHDPRNIKKFEQKQEPASSATYCSSMEMPSDKLAINTSSSVVIESNFGEWNHDSLRTSTELLKVVNRIWSLEEKHAVDVSLVKMLRRELDDSQAQIQELVQDKKRDQKEISELMKQITGHKIDRKKERDRIRDAVKWVEDRVEDELKLRRNSEKIHHKLAKKVSEMKTLLTNALKEVERERKARMKIEELCDEFGKGIRDYEKQVRLLKHKCCEDEIGNEMSDGLVLHMSEAWLDERTQIKLTNSGDVPEKHSALDKLGFEIETFLQAKQCDDSGESNPMYPFKSNNNVVTQSLESFHFKEPASAPWKDIDEGESMGGMSLSMIQKVGEMSPDSDGKAKASSKIEEQEEHDGMSNPRRRMGREGESEWMQRSVRERWNRRAERLEDDKNAESDSASLADPGKKWGSDDPGIFEATSTPSKSIKPTTLKDKLMEARLQLPKASFASDVPFIRF